MGLQIDDEATAATVHKLAALKQKPLDEALREAVEHEYERELDKAEFMRRIKEIQGEFASAAPLTGLKADKAFYDELSGEDELTGLP